MINANVSVMLKYCFYEMIKSMYRYFKWTAAQSPIWWTYSGVSSYDPDVFPAFIQYAHNIPHTKTLFCKVYVGVWQLLYLAWGKTLSKKREVKMALLCFVVCNFEKLLWCKYTYMLDICYFRKTQKPPDTERFLSTQLSLSTTTKATVTRASFDSLCGQGAHVLGVSCITKLKHDKCKSYIAA